MPARAARRQHLCIGCVRSLLNTQSSNDSFILEVMLGPYELRKSLAYA